MRSSVNTGPALLPSPPNGGRNFLLCKNKFQDKLTIKSRCANAKSFQLRGLRSPLTFGPVALSPDLASPDPVIGLRSALTMSPQTLTLSPVVSVNGISETRVGFSSSSWAIHINWLKCRLSACLDVNQSGTNRNCCTQTECNLQSVCYNLQLALGARSFSVASPKIRNSLPPARCSCRLQLSRHFPPTPQNVLLPPVGERSIAISFLFVCLSVRLSVCMCLSVREHISRIAEPVFAKFCVQMPCGRGSGLLWWRYDTLCTSGLWMMSRLAVMGRMAKRVGWTVMRLPWAALRYRGGVWCLWMNKMIVSSSKLFHHPWYLPLCASDSASANVHKFHLAYLHGCVTCWQ